MRPIRVVLTASFLGLFGFAELSTNYGAPPGASSDLKKTENQPNMPNSVSTLLTRNLNEVFGENDPVRRRKVIDEIFTDDAVFYDQGGVYRGRDEIDRIAGELRVMHRDFRYQPIGEPEEVGNGGRVRWTEGRSGEAPAVAGTDFIVTRDGRVSAIYLFFDKLP
jgi:SnoaL-like domain